MEKKVYITSDNYRQGFGQTGTLIAEEKGRYIVRFLEDSEEFICILGRNDFEFLD